MENLHLLTNLTPLPYPLGLNRRGYSTGFPSCRSQFLRLPAKAYPLADVIGQTGPQGFQSHLDQPTQPKLAQSNFVLNPRIGKFRHTSPLLIDGLSFRRLHLGLKRCQFRGLFAPDQRSPSLRPRATLGLKLTSPTLRSLGSVPAPQRSSLPLLSFIYQYLAPRTSITVSTPIILKGLRVKIQTHPTLLQPIGCNSASLRQGPNQIDLLLSHRLHRRLIRKAS